MRRAAIVSPLRTPVGKYQGALQSFNAEDLGALVIRALVDRSGIDPERIEEVIFAQGYPSGEAPCIGRWAALAADLPLHVSGTQVDRRCGSGLQAVANAAMMIQTGAADVVIAGGAESMSNVEYYTTDMRAGARSGSVTLHDRLERGRVRSQPEARFGHISGMIETAENLANEYQITREQADAYAMQSQQRAQAAWDEGKFDNELVTIAVPQKKKDDLIFDRDAGVRGATSMESLGKLRALNEGGIVMIETAENLANEYQITREQADAYAMQSQQRAQAAWDEGKFDNELVTIAVPQKKKDDLIFDRDAGVRGATSMESLGKLRALNEGGIVTAGNASQQNDAWSYLWHDRNRREPC